MVKKQSKKCIIPKDQFNENRCKEGKLEGKRCNKKCRFHENYIEPKMEVVLQSVVDKLNESDFSKYDNTFEKLIIQALYDKEREGGYTVTLMFHFFLNYEPHLSMPITLKPEQILEENINKLILSLFNAYLKDEDIPNYTGECHGITLINYNVFDAIINKDK